MGSAHDARARTGALAPLRRTFERYLREALDRRCRAPGRLGEAIRYAALSPGKRLRPLLALVSCEAVGGPWRRALPAAVAVECVHAFSLVHDDLPAMDDDDFRRGLPTTHKKFGEAMAILAGDALLAFAFEELTRLSVNGSSPARVLQATRILAKASGGERLVAGQALDIEAEGQALTGEQVGRIQEAKTGALFGAAMALGGIAAGGTSRQVRALTSAGVHIGDAFQIIDDLRDTHGSLRELGKRPGKDAQRRKATLHGAIGERETRGLIMGHVRRAVGFLDGAGIYSRRLERLLVSIADRIP